MRELHRSLQEVIELLRCKIILLSLVKSRRGLL